jgi:hypothetical protein
MTAMGGEGTSLEAPQFNGYARAMFDKRPRAKSAILIACSAAIISAAAPPEAPGTGVLCLGTFIYFAEKTGAQCRAGEDPEFQARIEGYVLRFDGYIIRNTGGDSAILTKFKENQHVTSKDRGYICDGGVAQSYDQLKVMSADKLDAAVDTLLARDGPPSFGDCV